MVASNKFTIASGTYTNEQELLLELEYFMLFTIEGWTKIKTVEDRLDVDLNIAFFSDGSTIGLYDRFYVRAQAVSNNLRFSVLSDFDDVSDTDFDSIGGTDGETELLTGTTSGTYWFMGNADNIHVVVSGTDLGGSLHGGFGHWFTYYNRLEDPKPFYVFGQTAQSQTFESALRVESYGPRSWGRTQSTTNSGVGALYEAIHPTEIANGTINPRTNEPKLMEPVFYTDASFPNHEIRGEIPGLFMCGGDPFDHGNITTITGTPSTLSGTYFIHKHTGSIAWAIGPMDGVTVTGTAPILFEGILAPTPICHLRSDIGVTAEFTISGSVSTWSDQSGNGNDWTQSTESRRPFLFENIQNSLPALFFDGVDDLLTTSAFISGSTPGEMFIVLQNTRTAATNDGFSLFGSDNSNDSHYTFTDDAVHDSFGSTLRKSTGVMPYSPRNWHVYNVRSASGDWTSNQNLSQHFNTGTNTVGWASTFKLGESLTQDWAGYIGEVILYNRILTGEERRKLFNYLIDRWDIVF